MKPSRRMGVALALVALAVSAAVWVTAAVQRETALQRGDRVDHVQELLLATQRQELEFRESSAVALAHRIRQQVRAERDFEEAAAAIRRESKGDGDVLRALDRVEALYRRWRLLNGPGITSTAPAGSYSSNAERHELVEEIAGAVGVLADRVHDDMDAKQRMLTVILLLLSVALCVGVGGAGVVLIGRRERDVVARQRSEEAMRERQGEFGEALQLVGDEREAHELLKRHLERSVDVAHATVLNRNNSANRLEATTPAEPKLAAALEHGAEPRACLAARAGRTHSRKPGDADLTRCQLCGGGDAPSTCSPLLVSGEVIGSVLLDHEQPLSDLEARAVTQSVAQAAPVLSNLRTLAIAETRAATDALTGLPNRRALHDTLRRMVAQAGRTLDPLAVLAIDLDHFKRINDTHGHDKGDDALAAVGRVLASSLRESDFAARAGGEEFSVLLPDTDADGAREVAEKLRVAISRIDVPGLAERMTASFGVATYPLHAVEAPALLRKADRALYMAKDRGRDRVEMAAEPTGSQPAETRAGS